IALGHGACDAREKRCQRNSTNRSARGRGSDAESVIARARALDERVLLLSARNGDAQSAPASDPARGSKLEKTTRGSSAGKDRQPGAGKTAQTRSASGGIAG